MAYMIFIAMMVFIIAFVNRMTGNEANDGMQYASSQAPIPHSESITYILRLHEGNIAVFFADNPDVPVRITDIRQETLRNFDREQLDEGIVAHGERELAMLLEDFGS